MAAVLGKNFQLPKTCSRILVSNLRRGYNFNHPRLIESKKIYEKTENRFLSTAVQKLVDNEELLNKDFSKSAKTNKNIIMNIDDAFAEIDSSVRRNGRTRRWNVETVLNMIKEAGTISSTHGLFLLRCCERMFEESPSNRIQLSDEIWSMLQNHNVKVEAAHFNSRLKLFVENQKEFSPGEFLSLMESYGVEPNKVTFSLLLEKFCNDGNLSGASEILEFMKTKNIPVTEKMFNIIIKGHINSNDFAGAENILEVMRSSNIIPNADSYTVLLCGYAKKNVEEMKSYLAKIQNMGVSLSDKHLLQIIKALALSNHSYIDEILMMMKNVSNYRQEFLNTAIELTHFNLEDVGCKLILAASDSDFQSGTNVFVRQLIKQRKPISTIFQFCQTIHEKGINEFILLNASKASLDHEMIDLTLMLYDEMNKKRLPVRQFSMYPVFSYYRENKLPEGAWRALKKMAEFGILPNFGFYRQHILPALDVMDLQSFINRLKEINLPVAAVIDPLFDYYCFHGKVDNALKLIESYPVEVHDNFSIKAFLSHRRHFERKPEAYFKVLKFVTENIGRGEKDATQGMFLAELIQSEPNLFDAFNKKMNCKVSPKSLNVCRDILSMKAPQYMIYLKRFENSRQERSTTAEQDMTIEEEKKQLSSLEANRLSCQSFLIERLMYHMRKRNVDRVSEIKLLLEEGGYPLSAAICAKLIGVFSEANNFEAVENLMQYLKEKYPTFKVDIVKALDYSTLLIKYEKFEKAIETLKDSYQNVSSFENKALLQRTIRKMLNTAAETGNADFVKNIQDLFISESNNFSSKELFLEPLIKTYIFRNEFDAAIECYKNGLKQNRVAPCLSLLLHKCIVYEDQKRLQKIVDLTSTYLGKIVAICELAAAFVEAGRPQQGFEALQSLNNRTDRVGICVEDICMRFHSRSKVNELCQFIAITGDLKHSNRGKMYHLLLSEFSKKNMFENAIAAWEMMRKEEIPPSKDTLLLLQELFQRNNQPIPNSIIEYISSTKAIESEGILENSLCTSNDFKKKFLDYVSSEEHTLALNEMNKMKKGYIRSITINELSKFVELLLKKKCLLDLSSNVQAMSYIIEYASEIFRPLLEKCAHAGDIEAIKTVYSFLPDFALRKVAFNNFYARAYCAREKHEDLLLELERNCENDNKFFSIFAIQELLKFPHLEERVLKLCEKYLTLDFDMPISVAFTHYFVEQNYVKVEEMIKHYSIAVEKVDSIILREIRQTENLSMGKKFIEILNKLTVKSRTKERAYGVLLDTLVTKEMYSDAAILASEAEGLNLSLHKYHSSTLVILKKALENENKPVPFTIRPENSDSAVSSN